MLITKPVICQYCHELMEYVKEDDFWRCSKCGGEFWFCFCTDEQKVASEEREYISLSYQGGAKGGSRSSKKVGAKERLKKKPVEQLFREL